MWDIAEKNAPNVSMEELVTNGVLYGKMKRKIMNSWMSKLIALLQRKYYTIASQKMATVGLKSADAERFFETPKILRRMVPESWTSLSTQQELAEAELTNMYVDRYL